MKRVVQAAFSTDRERAAWVEAVTNDLWEGRVDAVIRAAENLAPRCEEAQDAVTYITRNAQRMQYARSGRQGI